MPERTYNVWKEWTDDSHPAHKQIPFAGSEALWNPQIQLGQLGPKYGTGITQKQGSGERCHVDPSGSNPLIYPSRLVG